MSNKIENKLDAIEKNLLKTIADIEKTPIGAYNIRENGKGVARNTTANIDIVTKQDKPGIDIIIKPNTKNESVHIPVILTEAGFNDVEYAILETSGQVTVIQKPNKRTTTPEDFNIEPDYEGLPYDLVIDGKVLNENLRKIGKNEIWLKKQVEKFNMTPQEALIVTFDGKGQIFCQKKER